MEVYKTLVINKKEYEIINIRYEYDIILENMSIDDNGAIQIVNNMNKLTKLDLRMYIIIYWIGIILVMQVLNKQPINFIN